jgi:hypothetical protein
MKHLIIPIFAAILLASCEKERACEENGWGILKFTNSKLYAVELYLDGTYQQRVEPKSSAYLDKLPSKSYQVSAQGQTSYFNANIDIYDCKTTAVGM